MILILPVFIPARSSSKLNTKGEKVSGTFVDIDGCILVIVGFCGALNENVGVHVFVLLYSFGLSVTEIFTYTCFSISYGDGAGKLRLYPLILFCRVSILMLLFPVRSLIVSVGLAGVKVYGRDHATHVGQSRVILIVPLFTPSWLSTLLGATT